jgi:hypothetical protein
MPLAEGVAARLAIKAYASGTITANAKATSSSDLGATGGQILRRVASTLSLQKESYQSAEIRPDRQIGDYRHGVRRVQGSLSGELSPKTYGDLFEGAYRGTWVAGIAKSETELTSVAMDATLKKITFGGGNPVNEGMRVGHVLRFTNLSESTNNSKNFVVLAFGGTSNRELTVHPAPTDMAADVSFNVTSAGKRLFIPASSHVSRKFGIEHYHEDLDIARLFTECRIAGANVNLPATGMATVEFPVLGRDEEIYTGGSAPFFTGPAAITATGIEQAVNGFIRVGGAIVGVVTGLTINLGLNPEAPPVVGQDFVPEIFLGRGAGVTGQITALFLDTTFLDYHRDETEFDILAYLRVSIAADTPAMVFYLPRCKTTGADAPLQGETGQIVTVPFQALRYEGGGAGIESTTIQLVDTEIA